MDTSEILSILKNYRAAQPAP
jgi:hypothetical protein